MLDTRQYDCHLRVLRFAKLFVIVDYIPARRMWDAHIFNRKKATTPPCLTASYYPELLQRLAVFEVIEQGGYLS